MTYLRIFCGLGIVAMLAAAFFAPPLTGDDKEVVIEKPKLDEKSPSDKSKDDKAKEDKSKDDKAKDDKPEPGKTHTVARGPFKLEVSLPASIAAATTHEISIDPDSPLQLALREVVPHATRVTKGQTLLKFDTLKLDEEVRDLEASRALADLTLQQARRELEILTKSAPLDAELAAQAKQHADEDLNRFEKLDRTFSEKEAAFGLKSANQYLEYTQEELKQLEKMYKADDLTEETEEIILKRARNDVEQMKFYVERANFMHDRELQVELPRFLVTHRRAAAQAGLVLERTRLTQPLAIEKQKLEIQKQEFEQKKDADQLARLQADLKRLTVNAPAAGVVYYGHWNNGKWSGTTEIGQKLRPGGQIQPYEVLLTLVEPDGVKVNAEVAEKELEHVRAGIAGHFVAKAFPKQKLPVKVESLTAAPQSEGEFGATLTFEAAPPKSLAAGMTGDVKIVAYFKADALTVPAKSVFRDEQNDEQRYVYRVDKEGKSARRDVTVGHESETTAEITGGLAPGDKVLLEKPEE
ncbi:MAG TPA: HlyD family efflux transporter periplasmic adaptor subunit [Pirellulaceae bacterium]|nr:HlyD family efflux transporter periplasmic adaptor subunit [Pirellulaceae bacterium]